jgi:hypothetical protein
LDAGSLALGVAVRNDGQYECRHGALLGVHVGAVEELDEVEMAAVLYEVDLAGLRSSNTREF